MLKRIPWRPILAVIILVTTITVFARYLSSHPEVRDQLGNLSPALIATLLGLYILFVGSLALINSATLRLCKSSISGGESMLLTMYSSVINFFGPLQSGPAFRALYLNRKHGIKLKDYTLASFVYYFFYALFSVLLLLSGVINCWLLLLALVVLVAILYHLKGRSTRLRAMQGLSVQNWHYMAIASFIQVALMVVIYYVELGAVSPEIQLSQVLVYTGAGNLALFVSLTPGAIGFRESFLLLSQKLHGVDTSTIVAAMTIDRAVYVLMLVILAVFIFGTHARNRFR